MSLGITLEMRTVQSLQKNAEITIRKYFIFVVETRTLIYILSKKKLMII